MAKGQFKDSVSRSEKLKLAWANKTAEEKAAISAKRTGRPSVKISYNQKSHLAKIYRQTKSIEAVAKEGNIGLDKARKILVEMKVYEPKRGRPSVKKEEAPTEVVEM